MQKKDYPVLEFDTDRNAFINPSDLSGSLLSGKVARRCVLCFFGEAIDKILGEYPHVKVGDFRVETLELPIYVVTYKGEQITLARAMVGAPAAVAQVEEFASYGCSEFIACGSCGVLDGSYAPGHLIIPVSAVRDEGTSYHYVEPSREIEADLSAVGAIERAISAWKLPYVKAKTWTTDAIYRETPSKIEARKAEGCLTVEMEASAFMAVAKFRALTFGQILYAGDSLGGDKWDLRDCFTCSDTRELVLRVALDACLEL